MLHMMGVETEFSITALDHNGKRISPCRLSKQLLVKAKDRYSTLSDGNDRLYLGNGGLFYIDCGAHPEFATPECTSPDTVVQYIQAGEVILERLSKLLEDSPDTAEVRIFKGNVDYMNSDVTWGCHESYLYRSAWNQRARQLIPHLVSRIIFSGGGGWNNRSPGLEFSLSPRVNHLVHVVSDDTTQERGIFHSKNESHCGRHNLNRLHVICGDSAFSEKSNWLKMGTTALVVALVDHKFRVGDPVGLDSPIDAMRIFAADPTCQVVVKRADRPGNVGAIAIQRHYLHAVESHIDADFMPGWAPEVCRRWKTMLDRLENGPELVSNQIDWAIKYTVYREWVRRHSTLSWERFPIWTDVVSQLKKCLPTSIEEVTNINQNFVAKHHGQTGRIGNTIRMLSSILEGSGQSWKDLDEFLNLRTRLFELDVCFGEVSDSGIFRMLDTEGVLNHRLLKSQKLEHAINDPPTVGRPYLRGRWVKRLADKEQQYVCSWEGISGENRYLDLSDPFESDENWTVSIGRL